MLQWYAVSVTFDPSIVVLCVKRCCGCFVHSEHTGHRWSSTIIVDEVRVMHVEISTRMTMFTFRYVQCMGNGEGERRRAEVEEALLCF